MRSLFLLLGALCALSACRGDAPQRGLEGLSWGVPVALSTGGGMECRQLVFADTALGTQNDCGASARTDDSIATRRLTAIAVSLNEQTAAARSADSVDVARDVAHTRALIDLWYGTRNDTVLARAITALREASGEAGATAAMHSDLAAALLLRYQRGGDGLDLLTALDAAEQALILDPSSAPAAWNSALASTWIGLHRAQESAWARYERLSGKTRPHVDLGENAFAQNAKANARSGRWFDFTREYVWRTVGPDWGRAHLAGDSAGTTRALAELDTIAQNSRDPDRHHSPRAVLVVLQNTKDATARRELAEAFIAYADYWIAFYQGDYTKVDSALVRVQSANAFARAFPAWTWYLKPLLAVQRGAPADARRILDEEAPRFATVEYPWVQRRVAWLDALVKLTTREHAAARDVFIALEQECLETRDEECAVAVPAMRVGAENTLGDKRTAVLAGLRSARRASVQPITGRTLSAYGQLQRSVEFNRLTNAAAAMSEESESLAEYLQRTVSRLEQANRRAQEATLRVAFAPPSKRKGAIEIAAAAVDHFADVMKTVPQATQREFLNHLRLRRAEIAFLRDTRSPGDIARSLDSALALERVVSNANRLTQIRQLHARARLLAGDTVGAVVELDSALVEYRARGPRDITVFAEGRLLTMVRESREYLARALLKQGRSSAALAVLSGLALADSTRYARPLPASLWLGVRQLGDSVLLFTRASSAGAGANALRVQVAPARTSELLALIDRTDPVALSAMHDALVAPWRSASQAGAAPDTGATLLLDVQGVATRVPWPALRSARQGNDGRYLLEDFAMAIAPTGHTPRESVPMVRRSAMPTTLIIDAAPRAGAARLPGAVREIDAVSRTWGQSGRVVSTAAGANLQQAMQGTRIVHFAGHAIIDDVIPEQSALRIPTPTGDSLLRASVLSQYQLTGVELIILAACDTRVASVTPTSGLESLAGVLHRAGVGNVIAAGWPVDDDATALLMQRLHEALRAGLPPAAALRRAQLEMRRDPDPARNTPFVWSAFQLLVRGE
ncbi:MAG TPA: CHAT domain-containing protein [Gemmatimonas sp.]|uniref:CHAT domain-containing protein n=1 Tax=Gemmatimonas sp. TaxID=1962908 RepID=UPI002EDA028B